jgi:hypothetical protein
MFASTVGAVLANYVLESPVHIESTLAGLFTIFQDALD